MARKLTVTRLRERRAGWSLRAFDFELLLNDKLFGRIKDGKSISFAIPEEELLLEVRPYSVNRRTKWCAIIPPGKSGYRVTVSPWEHKEPIVQQMPAEPIYYLTSRPVPTYIADVEVDNVEGIENCFSVLPNIDLAQIVEKWIGRQIEPPYGENIWNWSSSGSKQLTLILSDAGQLDRSTAGKERCLEHDIKLMLDLGDGYYQNVLTGKFFVLRIGETREDNGDNPHTYGQLEWKMISAIPSKVYKAESDPFDNT